MRSLAVQKQRHGREVGAAARLNHRAPLWDAPPIRGELDLSLKLLSKPLRVQVGDS
jgi:hypothetical protein